MVKVPTDPYIREIDRIYKYDGIISIKGTPIPDNYPFEKIIHRIIIDHRAGRKKHYPRFLILIAKLCERYGIDWDEKFITEIAEDFFYVDLGSLNAFHALCGVINIACSRHLKLNKIDLRRLPGHKKKKIRALSLIQLKKKTKIRETPEGLSYMIYAQKFLEKQNLSEKLQSKVETLNEQILSKKTTFHAGRNPRGIAAALIYIAGLNTPEMYLTQRQICQGLGITEVTLRNTYKYLVNLSGAGEMYRKLPLPKRLREYLVINQIYSEKTEEAKHKNASKPLKNRMDVERQS